MVPAQFDAVVRLLLAEELALLEDVLRRAHGRSGGPERDRAGVPAGARDVQGVARLLPPVQGQRRQRVPDTGSPGRTFQLVVGEAVQVLEQAPELGVGKICADLAEQSLLDVEGALDQVGQEPHALHHIAGGDFLQYINHLDHVLQLPHPVLEVVLLLPDIINFPFLDCFHHVQSFTFLDVQQVVHLPEVVLRDLHYVVEPSQHFSFVDLQLIQLILSLVLNFS